MSETAPDARPALADAEARDPLEFWLTEMFLPGKPEDYICSIAEMVPSKIFPPLPELEACVQLDVPTLTRIASALRLLTQQSAAPAPALAEENRRLREALEQQQQVGTGLAQRVLELEGQLELVEKLSLEDWEQFRSDRAARATEIP